MHATLDVAGFIPGLGIAADLANAGIYTAEGNYVLAGLSAVAAVPGIGDSIKAGTMAAKAGKHLAKEVAEAVAGKAVKEVAEQAAEKAAKEVAEQTAEKGVKEAVKEGAEETAEGAAKKKGKDGVKVSGKCKKRYRRNLSERRKALKRDGNDQNNSLDKKARDYIKKHDGKKVPKNYEVAHEKPLYTQKTLEGKKALDTADNMKTIPKKIHRANHRVCGITYHDYPR